MIKGVISPRERIIIRDSNKTDNFRDSISTEIIYSVYCVLYYEYFYHLVIGSDLTFPRTVR